MTTLAGGITTPRYVVKKDHMIPLFKVFVAPDICDELSYVFSSGYIGEGERVKEFEYKLSQLYGNYVVTVNSCTSALSLAYHMIGLRDEEVISTAMTCSATNIPLLHYGANIKWADIDKNTGNMSADSLKSLITPKTKAVVCVHYGGNLCDSEIYDICKENNIPLIEDNAHLINSGYGDYQCYSFQAIKFLTTGDGGALVTSDKSIRDRAKLLRWYGIDRSSGTDMRCAVPITEAGYKYHMNDISATIGMCNFKYIEDIHNKTLSNAHIYNREFSNLKHIKTVPVKHSNDYWLYILLVDNKNQFMQYMKDNGIATSSVHARNDIHPIFKQSKVPLPNLDYFWDRQVCIPVGWWVNKTDTEYIVEKVKQFDEICVD